MDKFVDLLGSVLDKVGLTATALWPHAVRYTFTEALVALLSCGIGIGACVLISRNLWTLAVASVDSDGAFFAYAGSVLVLGAAIIIFFVGTSYIPALIDPQYAAVLRLIHK